MSVVGSFQASLAPTGRATWARLHDISSTTSGSTSGDGSVAGLAHCRLRGIAGTECGSADGDRNATVARLRHRVAFGLARRPYANRIIAPADAGSDPNACPSCTRPAQLRVAGVCHDERIAAHRPALHHRANQGPSRRRGADGRCSVPFRVGLVHGEDFGRRGCRSRHRGRRPGRGHAHGYGPGEVPGRRQSGRRFDSGSFGSRVRRDALCAQPGNTGAGGPRADGGQMGPRAARVRHQS